MISASYFPTLGVDPILGRGFTPEEDRVGAPPVALVGEGFWKRTPGGRKDALGRTLTRNGVDYAVVGIVLGDVQPRLALSLSLALSGAAPRAVPAGMRPLDATNAGYDEITHINRVVMQAMPDSVLPVSNGIMRFEGPGRCANDVNLDSAPIEAILGAMAEKKIYSDPTMVAFEGLYVPERGDLSPSCAPFVGTMPPTTERGFRQDGFAVPKGLTRADYRARWAKMVALLGKMHAAGIPIVAGTDGAGIEIIRELEIYERAPDSAAAARR